MALPLLEGDFDRLFLLQTPSLQIALSALLAKEPNKLNYHFIKPALVENRLQCRMTCVLVFLLRLVLPGLTLYIQSLVFVITLRVLMVSD
jgi:hypothetical protein